MHENACDAFRAAMTEVLASPGPVDLPSGHVRHLNACEACQSWFDAQDLGVDEDATDEQLIERMAPLLLRLEELEAGRPPDPAALALQATHDRREAELLAAIEGFIAKHPALAPEKHGIPTERYSAFIFFHAVDAMNLLMRGYHRRDDRGPHAFALREDGAIFIDGEEAIPVAGVRKEIGRWIRDCRIVPEAEKTPDLEEAFRREAAWSDDETCAKLAAWAVEAVRAKPDLMRNFRLTEMSLGSPQYLALEYLPTGTGDRDHLDLWK